MKSFYASVECREMGYNPLTTNLVVADESRTEKTICLAVSPSLKAWGISGRPRLYEVIEKIRRINLEREKSSPGGKFTGKSFDDNELKRDKSLELDFIIARPRMAYYIKYSTDIYRVYLKYAAPEDIHVYSVDEIFVDITDYLKTAKKTPREFVMCMIKDVLATTGITAAAGIGTNLYLCKIAMDISAKHMKADENGVRIACLDEMSYRKKLWNHRPITDFWRVGKGYAKKLADFGMYTMGDIARCSLGKKDDFYNEDLLYKLFGINAELLIDHAWGYEPCTIADIKSYKPSTKSLGSGQVLQNPYPCEKAKLVAVEMTDLLSLDLAEKNYMTNRITMTVGYDIENLSNPLIRENYHGAISTDAYGRSVPKSAHGSENLGEYTSSSKVIIDAASRLFDRIIDKNLLVRRINISADEIKTRETVEKEKHENEQIDFMSLLSDDKEEENKKLTRENDMQKAVIRIKKKYGKNAILKGMNLREGATAKERNSQIGGHKA